ncbi:hypothetical protein [Shewanella sp. TC10]|uniref:hypothetical protein n=1 Tax=Shewanella sp. TC10 TaxID=1419739 RepID=UPI00129D8525|nr:hypothetical protein [Shewanella sp. TC10]
MNEDKIESVMSENLGEGYRIVNSDGTVSPIIEWVDWVQLSDDENDIRVEVHFSDDSDKTFDKGIKIQQIWHEDASEN